MNNDFIEKYKNEPKVKKLLDELSEAEKEFAQKQKEEEKQKKTEYKNWFNSLSAEEKYNEKIRLEKEKIKKLQAQKKEELRKKAKSKSQKERDDRTHYLIQLGAELDSALKNYFSDYISGDEENLEFLKTFLYVNGQKGMPFFPEYWKFAVDKTRLDKQNATQKSTDSDNSNDTDNLF